MIQSNIEQTEVIKGLTQVVKDILTPGFTVKKIYSKEDRQDYIKKFPKSSVPNHKAKTDKPWQFTQNAKGVIVTGGLDDTTPNPKERKCLIPKRPAIKISNPKANSIYHELTSISVDKFKNATAVLLRVFVEMSVDSYLEANKLIKTHSAQKAPMNLEQKIHTVANHLMTTDLADKPICEGIKTAIKEKNGLLSIDTMNAYIHNNKFSPKTGDLMTTWDNMHQFILILWNNISN